MASCPASALLTHMPGPLGELSLPLLARVEALPAALDPGRWGEYFAVERVKLVGFDKKINGEKTKFHVNIFPDVSFSSDSLQPNIRPPVGGGEDAHRGRVVRDEAADVVVGEAAVGVRGAAAASTQVHSVTILVKLMIKPGEMENNSFSNDSAIQLYYKILQCMLYSL